METIKRPVVKDPRICLALPVYSAAHIPFVQCMMNTLSNTKIIAFVDFLPGDSLVNRARNNLAGRFLAGHDTFDEQGNPIKALFDWLLFIDTDLVFQPSAVQMLYDLGLSRGPGIYCGTYPIKQLKPKVVFNNLPGEVPGPDGTVKVREAGTGFMLIHREVFEKMRERFREEIEFIADTGDQSMQLGWDFFTVGVRMDTTLKRKRFLSEDWYFCQRWREMGGDVILQTKIQCGHIGPFTYPGNPTEIIETAEILKKAMNQHGAKAVSVKTVAVKTVTKEPELVAATD